MDWKFFFLLFVILIVVACEEDEKDDSVEYDEKRFHIQGRQAGDEPHCVVTRRRRSINTHSNRKKYYDSPSVTSVTGSPVQVVTGHQIVETSVPTSDYATHPTGTGIIDPTGTVTDIHTPTSQPDNNEPETATATVTTSPTEVETSNPADNGGYRYPNREYKDKYNKKYKKTHDNKKTSKIEDVDVEKIGSGIKVGTNTRTNTKTGTRTKTVTLTKTGTGMDEIKPHINCIIVNRPTPPPANNGIFGNLFSLRRRRSLRNIRKKFGLN